MSEIAIEIMEENLIRMKKKNEVKAVVYMRCAKLSGFTIEAQQKSITGYCDKNNIEILKIFKDCASGNNYNRPGWKEMLLFLSEHENHNTILLVTHFDRCTRNFLGALQIVEMLNKKGIKLIESETGKDITRLFKKNSIHFIISNVQLKIKNK